jgi:hypothetical protein
VTKIESVPLVEKPNCENVQSVSFQINYAMSFYFFIKNKITNPPWHVDSSTINPLTKQEDMYLYYCICYEFYSHLSNRYNIVDAHATDCKRVTYWYQQCPVPGYDIKSVRVVHNPQMSRVFEGLVAALISVLVVAVFLFMHIYRSSRTYKLQT